MREAGGAVGAVGAIILAAVSIITVSTITTAEITTTIVIVKVEMAIEVVAVDMILSISMEITRIIKLVMVIRVKDNRMVRILSPSRCSDGYLKDKDLSLNLYTLL